MIPKDYRKSAVLSEPQKFLLWACLKSGQSALKAWRKWKATIDIENLEIDSQELLPLLYQNLINLGVQDPLLKKIKGAYRYHWYKNQLLLSEVSKVLQVFIKEGIKILALKGAAQIFLYYENPGLRPMNDFDLLVPKDSRMKSILLLKKLGLSLENTVPHRYTENYLSTRHAFHFEGSNKMIIDLHFNVLTECCYPNTDEDFWNHSRPLTLMNLPIYTLSPSDQILQICSHGMKHRRLIWVPDVMKMLQNEATEIDWNRIYNQALKRHLIVPVGESLLLLKEELEASIPTSIVDLFGRTRVSFVETQAYYKAVRSKKEERNWIILMLSHFLRNSWYAPKEAGQPKIILMGRYLQSYWGLHHLGEVPFYFIYKMSQVIVRSILKKIKKKLNRPQKIHL